MKLKFILILSVAFILAVVFESCKRESPNSPSGNDNGGPVGNVTVIDEMKVPDDFDYATTHEVTLDVSLADALGNPFAGTKVSLYDGIFDPSQPDPKELYTGFTDANGKLYTSLSLPTYLKEIVVFPYTIGIPNNIPVTVSSKTIKFHYSNGEIQSRIAPPTPANTPSTDSEFTRKAGVEDKFSSKLGTWDTDGKPNYLESQRDLLSSTFLNNINTSFPEYRPVPTYHPEYLLETNKRNLEITQLSDVWITFVHEGAGYRNALFYYTYHKDSVPQSDDDIDSLYIIFPNTSFKYSGGGLRSGDKVKIGRFEKDYVIAFGLAANGYNINTDKVTAGFNFWYTNKELNDESQAYKQHTALLHDGDNDRFIISFEDLKRTTGQSDEDFNDALFFATSNPVEGIDKTNIPPLDKPGDSDNDGVNDVYDDYPNDATKAYDRYFPTENDYGTLAFEDLWPHKGDYDMNDLIVRWRFHAVANAQNKVVELNTKTFAAAKGGSFPIGFGVEFPFNASAVSNATGTQLTQNRTTLASNGLEEGNTKAVLIFFDEAADQLTHAGGSFFNTVISSGVSIPDTINTKITFNNPLSFDDLGIYPFNPFIFINGRGAEVHLPDHANTAKANTSLFGTGKDNSIPSQGRYYKTATNLPWAMHIPTTFEYPKEKAPIIDAYNKFSDWAQSAGASNEGWYLNVVGNRTETNIYKR
jgi:LruC domain-containing protein